MSNLEDKIKVDVQTKAAADRLTRVKDDLEDLMEKSEAFRNIISYWLEKWGVKKIVWDDHGMTLARNAGKQDVGADIYEFIMDASPNGILKMIKEEIEAREKVKIEYLRRLDELKK